jgi:hypothetical protein
MASMRSVDKLRKCRDLQNTGHKFTSRIGASNIITRMGLQSIKYPTTHRLKQVLGQANRDLVPIEKILEWQKDVVDADDGIAPADMTSSNLNVL